MTGLIIALSILAVGCAVELGLRLYMRCCTRRYVFTPGMRVHMHIDQESLPGFGALSRFEVNRDGERGPEPPQQKDGTYRVLVVGGSAGECFYLDNDETWPAVLERHLTLPDNLEKLGAQRVHVGNIAKSGVGSAAMNLTVQGVLPHYDDLDLIICMVGVSDVLKWLSWGAQDDGSAPPISEGSCFAVQPDQSRGWAPRSSAIADFLRQVRWRFGNRIEVRENTGGTLQKVRKMRQNADTLRDETGDPGAMLNLIDHHLTSALETCKRHAPRVIVARQAWYREDETSDAAPVFWNGAQGDPFKEHVDTYFSLEIIRERMTEMDNRVATVSESVGVEHMELRPLIEGNHRYMYDLFHYNPHGAEVVGLALARRILGTDGVAED